MPPSDRPASIELVELRCNGCAASLRLPPRATFVTCDHCCASLHVQREGGAAFTVVLDAVERVGHAVSVIELQNRLERLDREWVMREAQLMTQGEGGRRTRPSKAGSLIAAVAVAGFGLFWMSQTASMGAPAFFPLLGLVAIGFGVFRALVQFGKADTYQTERRAYERRRNELARAIARGRRS